MTDLLPETRRSPAASRATAFVAVAVFGSILGYSLIQAPIPAPNEPHYLCKAKHYWDAEFCPGDFFLESSNAHLVFYQTVGLLTLWLSLPHSAFVARLIAYGLLAVGWTSCVSRLASSRAAPLWAAWVFLAIATVGNLSGEWMVGGVEAKVFAYAFVLLAIARLFDRRWRMAGVFAGLAVSFHPVVGGWAVVAGGMATAATWFLNRRRAAELVDAGRMKDALIGLVLCVVCALPGLIPALQLVHQERLKSAASANEIQVFERLGHHLNPRQFRSVEFGDYEIEAAWLGYALLGLFAVGLQMRMERSNEQKWFGRFVVATAVIAIGGAFVGLVPQLPDGRPDAGSAWFELRVSLMKFYPFRLADVFVPIAAAISFVAMLESSPVAWNLFHVKGAQDDKRRSILAWNKFHATDWARHLSAPLLFVGFLAFAYLRPIADRNPSHMKPDEFRDWVAVCRWADENLPADAVVLTPPSNWGFKWYAGRTEFVSYKDCPQDAAGILEWRRRLRFITKWGNDNYRDGYSRAALQKLTRDEGITHVITFAEIGPFAVRPVYPRGSQRNERYRVYRLADAKVVR